MEMDLPGATKEELAIQAWVSGQDSPADCRLLCAISYHGAMEAWVLPMGGKGNLSLPGRSGAPAARSNLGGLFLLHFWLVIFSAFERERERDDAQYRKFVTLLAAGEPLCTWDGHFQEERRTNRSLKQI